MTVFPSKISLEVIDSDSSLSGKVAIFPCLLQADYLKKNKKFQS